MKKKNLLIAAGATVAGIAIANRVYLTLSNINNHLPLGHAKYYASRFGNVYYTVCGEGSPVLLIHDLLAEANGEEWVHAAEYLSRQHTVYTLDLPGCGRSDKPDMLYTQYVHDLLIQNFIRDVIGEKTDIVTAGRSIAVALMAGRIEGAQVGRVIAVNPPPLSLFEKGPAAKSRGLKYLLDSPVFGTFIYNAVHSRPFIRFRAGRILAKTKPGLSDRITNLRFHSAHYDYHQGRAFFASCITRYMNLDIRRALIRLEEPLTIVQGENSAHRAMILRQYNRYVPHLESYEVKGVSDLPHVENPGSIAGIISLAISRER